MADHITFKLGELFCGPEVLLTGHCDLKVQMEFTV
jgi:hypothetical protein